MSAAKDFWNGPLTWLGGIFLAGAIIAPNLPQYATTNVHPDYLRDVSCQTKLSEAYSKALDDPKWYEKGLSYDYLKTTIYAPCQAKLREWYMEHHPEYNQTVRIK